jgi:hypothetical protein
MTSELIQSVLFDVSRQGYVAWREAGIPFGIAVVAAGVALATRVPSTMPDLRKLRQVHLMMRLVAVVAFVAVLIVLGSTWSDYQYLRNAEARGAYRATAGMIRAFVPEGPEGRPHESFDVNGVHFNYSSNEVTSAYHRTLPEGGQLRNGMLVRILDVGGRIIRVETDPTGSR